MAKTTGQIGKLRHRVMIQQNSPSVDSFGELTESWSALASNVPAKVESLTGRELIQGEQQEGVVTHMVTIRYRSDVTSQMRVVHNSKNFNIESALDPDGMTRRLFLMCKELA